MAPEYVMHGKFSVKSDVFSFGVLVLEIVTGHKNSSFQNEMVAEDLLTHVSADILHLVKKIVPKYTSPLLIYFFRCNFYVLRHGKVGKLERPQV